jgi:integrase
MFLMAIDCGLRLGELLAVKWEYVLWDEMRYSVTEQLLRPTNRQPGDLGPQSRSEVGPPKDNSYG